MSEQFELRAETAGLFEKLLREMAAAGPIWYRSVDPDITDSQQAMAEPYFSFGGFTTEVLEANDGVRVRHGSGPVGHTNFYYGSTVERLGKMVLFVYRPETKSTKAIVQILWLELG